MDRVNSVQLKAELLSKGLELSDMFVNMYDKKFLEKRRAYGNQDPVKYLVKRIPQELYILPENLICAINIKSGSPWLLDYCDGDNFLYDVIRDECYNITFPLRPHYYDLLLSNGKQVSHYVTLYGGSSLGVFIYGDCAFSQQGLQCHYCSLHANKGRNEEFENLIKKDQLIEVIDLVLADPDSNNLKQIMINGGNIGDPNNNFLYYAYIIRHIADLLNNKKYSTSIDLHLIVYPPDDLNLIDCLKGINVAVSINTEVFDFRLFGQYCPGKALATSRQHHYDALSKCVDVLGRGNVFSVFVGGLESIDSLNKGLNHVCNIGVIPVINVLHTDPETRLDNFTNPTPTQIEDMGLLLQSVYAKCAFIQKPFYENCGRNSIDYEAFQKMFTEK